MAGFETLDLGRVFQQAEGIKALKRQEGDDLLRRQYMQQQMSAGQQAQDIQKQQFATENQARIAKTRYLEAGAILQSSDPLTTAKMYAPELITKFDEHNGAGAFEKLTAEQVKQLISQAQPALAAAAGIQPKVKYIDLGGQQIAVDEHTGLPVAGAPSLTKSASPDSLLSSQTARENARLSASTAIRGQDLSAGTTVRGQDLAAQTAAAGRDVTMRGQDISANTAIRGQDKAAGNKAANVTEGERKAAALGTRLEGALRSLNEIEKVAPGASRPGLLERGAEAIGAEMSANILRSPERQQANAAQLDALDAALTLATGAAYTKEQLANLRTSYFPQIGDSDETVKSKQARFNTIVETARIAAGRAEPAINEALWPRGAPQIKSDAEYAQLPSGAQYVAPDGSTRTKR